MYGYRWVQVVLRGRWLHTVPYRVTLVEELQEFHTVAEGFQRVIVL